MRPGLLHRHLHRFYGWRPGGLAPGVLAVAVSLSTLLTLAGVGVAGAEADGGGSGGGGDGGGTSTATTPSTGTTPTATAAPTTGTAPTPTTPTTTTTTTAPTPTAPTTTTPFTNLVPTIVAAPEVVVKSVRVSGNRVEFKLACTFSACELAASLKTFGHLRAGRTTSLSASGQATGTKTLQIGSGRLKVMPGRTDTITLSLNATGLRLLGSFHSIPTSATIALTNGRPVTTIHRTLTVASSQR